jgi:hypothetical protein
MQINPCASGDVVRPSSLMLLPCYPAESLRKSCSGNAGGEGPIGAVRSGWGRERPEKTVRRRANQSVPVRSTAPPASERASELATDRPPHLKNRCSFAVRPSGAHGRRRQLLRGASRRVLLPKKRALSPAPTIASAPPLLSDRRTARTPPRTGQDGTRPTLISASSDWRLALPPRHAKPFLLAAGRSVGRSVCHGFVARSGRLHQPRPGTRCVRACISREGRQTTTRGRMGGAVRCCCCCCCCCC